MHKAFIEKYIEQDDRKDKDKLDFKPEINKRRSHAVLGAQRSDLGATAP